MSSWFPISVSTYGGEIDAVFFLIFKIVAVWFVATQGVLFYFLFRYRRRAGRSASYVRGESRAEVAWLLVPAVIILALDLGIDLKSGPAWARVKEQAPERGVTVRANAKQFNWEFIYPGPDERFDTDDDLTLENELHVPLGENVHLELRAKDVIHSFFVPALRLKQDILPGRTIKAWFNATAPGEYEIGCAELCGFGHYTMRGFLNVHDADDYARWRAERWPAGKTS